MLVYQLLSHERKKMYWEQLELRCRSVYPGPPQPPQSISSVTGGSAPGQALIDPRAMPGSCRCCEQCHSHRNVIPSAYPWDGDNRFWTPAPGQTGNFYSPNPGGDDIIAVTNRQLAQVPTRNHRPGWSWPRLPWQRNEPQRYRQTPSSPDSQYGFTNSTNVPDHATMQGMQQAINNPSGYTVIGGPPHYGVWGPPPPYSDPNSPARRGGRYQYIHPSHCQQIIDHNSMPNAQQSNIAILECHQHSSSTDSHSMEQFCSQQQTHRNIIKRQSGNKTKESYENTLSDSDGPRDRFSNTLPVRKQKKRTEIGAKSIGHNNQSTAPSSRVNVQNVFIQPNNKCNPNQAIETNYEYHEASEPGSTNQNHIKQMRRSKAGVENSAFLSVEAIENDKCIEPPESEVYFADVSSCCNMSVKNDNFYDETNQKLMDKFSKEENEDYLVQRFGKREASIRSRLPFPQMIPEDYEKPNQLTCTVMTSSRPSMQMQKDISRQSMCSMDSGEKTDFTDLSPATPSSCYVPNYTLEENDEIKYQSNYPSSSSSNNNSAAQSHFSLNYKSNDFSEPTSSSFVASFPYSCNEQSQEAHRRTTKNLQDIFLAPDAQYEMIKDTSSSTTNCGLTNNTTSAGGSSSSSSNSTNVPNSADLNNVVVVSPAIVHFDNHHHHTSDGGNNLSAYNSHSIHFHKPKSPKTLNITPIKRHNVARDIIDSQDINNSCSNKLNKLSETDWSDHSDRRL